MGGGPGDALAASSLADASGSTGAAMFSRCADPQQRSTGMRVMKGGGKNRRFHVRISYPHTLINTHLPTYLPTTRLPRGDGGPMRHNVGELRWVRLRDLLDQGPEGWPHPIDEVIPERPLDRVGVEGWG